MKIEIDKKIEKFIIRNAPKPIVQCGAIVTSQWGNWKKPHKVRIYKISAEITNLNLTIGERKKLGIKGFVGVELDYFANRINDDGKSIGVQGMVLSNFITEDGQQWEKVGHTFNFGGLTAAIESQRED